MATASGVVEKIVSKPTRTGGTAYSFVIEGKWYGHAFDKPAFVEGDNISFDYKENGNFNNANPKSVKIVASEPAAKGGPAPAKGGYQNNQVAIQYQASRNAAIHAVEAAVAGGIVPLPAKKADQYDAYLALIDDLTNRYHMDTDQVVTAGGVYPDEFEQAMASSDGFE